MNPEARDRSTLKRVVATSLGIAFVGMLAMLLGHRSVDLEKGEIWTPQFAANEIRDAARGMFNDRGWRFVTSEGTPETWTHIAEDNQGRKVIVQMTFGFPKSPTRISLTSNPDYDLRDLTEDLASRLGINAAD